MDFFTKHDAALRKGRLLQAAGVLFAYYRGLSLRIDPESGPKNSITDAVDAAFALENEIEARLNKGDQKCLGNTSKKQGSSLDLTDIS